MTDEQTPVEVPEQAPPEASATPPAEGAAPAEAAPIEAAPEPQVAALEQQLAEERTRATEYMQRWQRAEADFANYKRRAQQDQEQRERMLTASALSAVLPALDSFERAYATLPPSLRGFSWMDGVHLIELQLRRALELRGIRPVAARPGERFDPAHHEAVGELETTEHPEGSIAAVVQNGYEMPGLLLRPTLVQVARPPRPAPSAAEAADAAPEPSEAERVEEESGAVAES